MTGWLALASTIPNPTTRGLNFCKRMCASEVVSVARLRWGEPLPARFDFTRGDSRRQRSSANMWVGKAIRKPRESTPPGRVFTST